MQECVFVNEKIEFVWNSEVVEVFGGDVVKGVQLCFMVDGILCDFFFDGLFIVIGNDLWIYFVYDKFEFMLEGIIWVDGCFLCIFVFGVFVVGDVIDFIYCQVIMVVGFGMVVVFDVEYFFVDFEDVFVEVFVVEVVEIIMV